MSDDELDDFLNIYSTKNTTSLFKKQLCDLKKSSNERDCEEPNPKRSVYPTPPLETKDHKEASNSNNDSAIPGSMSVEEIDPIRPVSPILVKLCSKKKKAPENDNSQSKNTEVISQIKETLVRRGKKSLDNSAPLEVATASSSSLDESPDIILVCEESDHLPPSRYNTRSRAKKTQPVLVQQSLTKKRNSSSRKVKAKKSRICHDFIEEIPIGEPVAVEQDENEWNYEVTVKVLWKSVDVVKFNIRKFQRLDKVYEHFMKDEGVSREEILLTLNGVEIRPADTPESLKISVVDFIEGGVVKGRKLSKNDAAKSKYPTTLIRIKLEDGGYTTCECPTIFID